jgi:phosphotransferase system  glucose/maltose/N-acetylglucosamine-specific IIC component
MVDHELESSLAWRWWKIVWTVSKNLFYIFVILVAFSKASSAFENVVVCSLVLIYESVNWASTTQVRLAIEESFSNKRLLFAVLKKVGEETDEAEMTIGESEKEYLKQNTLYYINLGGALIVYFIVLWKLFTTLFA